jgi:hypothetical protein
MSAIFGLLVASGALTLESQPDAVNRLFHPAKRFRSGARAAAGLDVRNSASAGPPVVDDSNQGGNLL